MIKALKKKKNRDAMMIIKTLASYGIPTHKRIIGARTVRTLRKASLVKFVARLGITDYNFIEPMEGLTKPKKEAIQWQPDSK